MSSPHEKHIDDELIVRYLLSELSEQETERLDELSIVDDEFAWQLSAAENDLIDGYVRGELSAERRQRFQSLYLSEAGGSASPGRLEKVRFAEGLLRREQSIQVTEKIRKPRHEALWNSWLQFGAVAAFLVLSATGYFLYRRLPSDNPVADSAAAQVKPAPATESQNGKALRPPEHTVSTAVFLLLPTTRSPERLPKIASRPGTDVFLFRLQLELDEFPLYRATLTDLASNKSVWQSGVLRSESQGKNKELPVRLPAALLSSRNYSFDISGVPAAGLPELIASYPFSLVIR